MAGQDLIVGVGSPHGDDAIGWLAVERLAEVLGDKVRVIALRQPIELVSHLDDCRRLWIIDACRSGRSPGDVLRFRWPDELPALGELGFTTASSSHGLGVEAALRLAETLGKAPPHVVIFAIETAAPTPSDAVSAEVTLAVAEVERRLIDEIKRPLVEITS